MEGNFSFELARAVGPILGGAISAAIGFLATQYSAIRGERSRQKRSLASSYEELYRRCIELDKIRQEILYHARYHPRSVDPLLRTMEHTAGDMRLFIEFHIRDEKTPRYFNLVDDALVDARLYVDFLNNRIEIDGTFITEEAAEGFKSKKSYLVPGLTEFMNLVLEKSKPVNTIS